MEEARGSPTQSEEGYSQLLDLCYLKVGRTPSMVHLPSVKVISVQGNAPPGSDQFQLAVKALYSLAYQMRMSLKLQTLVSPTRYFDYKVGALEATWWSTTGALDTNDPQTLRWKLFLMVPDFVESDILDAVKQSAARKHPETDTSSISLETLDDEDAVQMLHIGPYSEEQRTIDALAAYAEARNLEMCGPHHEIYISDPNRTRPERLRTVIRHAVRPASTGR